MPRAGGGNRVTKVQKSAHLRGYLQCRQEPRTRFFLEALGEATQLVGDFRIATIGGRSAAVLRLTEEILLCRLHGGRARFVRCPTTLCVRFGSWAAEQSSASVAPKKKSR